MERLRRSVNGCEVDTNSNKFRCGGCLPSDANSGGGEDCTDIESNGSKHVTATECSAGGCEIVGCETGFADCNGVFSDGCEVNTVTDDDHCGGCTSGPTTTWDGGFVCDGLYDNGSGTCADSTCSFDECDTDYGDCNDDAALGASGDGCEEFLVGNDAHCGVCDNECITNAATSGNSCTASGNRACSPTCANPTNNGNCDGNGANGCETQLQVAETHCGTCNNNCNTSIGSNNITQVDCVTGGCEVLTCDTNRADCDGDFGDGCEVNTNSSDTHCGGCTSGPTTTWDGGENCNNKIGNDSVTGVNCSSGDCEVQTCSANRADCDGSWANGCEVNTNTSTTHCGDCTSGPTTTWDGGENCAAKANATVTCTTGSCVWSCESGWKDSNGDLQAGSSNGCETAIIGIVNEDTTGTGRNGSGDLVFNHNLETTRASNNKRAVVVLIGYDGNNVDLPPSVTYGGAGMTNARAIYSGNQAWAGVYYILDAALPSGAGTNQIVIDGNQHNTENWTVHVIELVNIDQSSPVQATAAQGEGGVTCNADRTVATSADAFVVSVLNTEGNDTFTATDGQTVMTELLVGDANTIAGYFEEVPAGTRRVRWGCNDSQWAHVVVSFNPEGTD